MGLLAAVYSECYSIVQYKPARDLSRVVCQMSAYDLFYKPIFYSMVSAFVVFVFCCCCFFCLFVGFFFGFFGFR